MAKTKKSSNYNKLQDDTKLWISGQAWLAIKQGPHGSILFEVTETGGGPAQGKLSGDVDFLYGVWRARDATLHLGKKTVPIVITSRDGATGALTFRGENLYRVLTQT